MYPGLILVLQLGVPGTESVPPPNPSELISKALDDLKTIREQATHYAFDNDYRDSEYSETGKELWTFSGQSQSVMVNGEWYQVSSTINGKKQTRAQMDAWAQSAKTHAAAYKADEEAGLAPAHQDLQAILSDTYTRKVAGRVVLDGFDCLLLEAEPVGVIINGKAQMKFRFWIDSVSHHVVREDIIHLNDDDPGMLSSMRTSSIIELKGSVGTNVFRPVDGVWLPYESISDNFYRPKDKTGSVTHLHSVSKKTNYQRYRATMKIIPANAVSE